MPHSALIIFPIISYSMLFFAWTTLQLKLIEYFAKTTIELKDTTPWFWISCIVTPLWITFMTYKDLL